MMERREIIRQTLWIFSLAIVIFGNTSCAHRSGHASDRNRSRTERHERRVRGERGGSRNQDYAQARSYSEEYLQSVAASDDYDAMLDCMFARIDELKALENEYLGGNMPDKVAKAKGDQIVAKYMPVEKALDKANAAGELTYDQHKRQMELVGEYMQELEQVSQRVGNDLMETMGR